MPLLQAVDTVVLFVPDIEKAAKWYATLFDVEVEYENPKFAFIRAAGAIIGFHPADAKCPGGVGGTTVYWTVASPTQALSELEARGARLLRGPGVTSLGDAVALLVAPSGAPSVCSSGRGPMLTEGRSRPSADLTRPGPVSTRADIPANARLSSKLLRRVTSASSMRNALRPP